MSDEQRARGRDDRPRRQPNARDGAKRDGFKRDGTKRDGFKRDAEKRDGFKRDGAKRDGFRRDGSRRDGFKRDGFKRDGEKRDGQKRNGFNRDGAKRDGFKRDGAGERTHRGFRGERDAQGRRGDRGDRGGRGERGGRGRRGRESDRLQQELRPVRSAHTDPEIPEGVQAKDLPAAARNELKTLDKHLGDTIAKHLVMAAYLIHTDPETAHAHATSAARRAGRIPVTRETLAMTNYVRGDFAAALRELRTYRRLTGKDTHLAIMIDCERGLGRPERGLELAREADQRGFTVQQRVHTAIALSGVRLDLGQTEQALAELEIPELNPNTAYPWSGELFRAYSAVLEDLGRDAEAAQWMKRAEIADAAVHEARGGDQLEIIELEETEPAAGERDEAASPAEEA